MIMLTNIVKKIISNTKHERRTALNARYKRIKWEASGLRKREQIRKYSFDQLNIS